MRLKKLVIFLIVILTFAACSNSHNSRQKPVSYSIEDLPEPYATPSVNNGPKVTGWPAGKTPVAPAGFSVTTFADSLDNPRWIYVGPNGDAFVSMANTRSDGFQKTKGMQSGNKSSNTVLLLRDADKDGIPETKTVFLTGLNRPLGMLILNNQFYVANTDGLYVYPYTTGQTSITSTGRKILDLPAGGYNNHWTRNLLVNADGSKIYISVGSGSNVGENGMEYEVRRANILEINPDGTGEKIYASGLRNPVGMDWAPGSNALWTAVNERDNLGDNLVPDYATSVQPGGFYGWPYAYFGANEDPRRKGERPDLVAKTIVPDQSLGSHTASLGLTFNKKNHLSPAYAGGMFIGQHGSWNRSVPSGYKVVYVPFKNGKPSGPPQDFLTGFMKDTSSNIVYGRPVGVTFAADGSLLVADDSGKKIWRISKK